MNARAAPARRLKSVQRYARIALPCLILAGCFGGGDDIIEPPAELIPFDSDIDVRRVWSTKIGGATERLRLGLQPASDGANIYVGSYDGRVEALNAETGRSQWSVRIEANLTAGPAFGDGNLAFGTANGDLIILDAQSGEMRWQRAAGSEVIAPPAIGAGMVVFRRGALIKVAQGATSTEEILRDVPADQLGLED